MLYMFSSFSSHDKPRTYIVSWFFFHRQGSIDRQRMAEDAGPGGAGGSRVTEGFVSLVRKVLGPYSVGSGEPPGLPKGKNGTGRLYLGGILPALCGGQP